MIKTIVTDWHGVIDRKTFGKLVQLIAEETKQDSLMCGNLVKEIAEQWKLGKTSPDVFWKELEKMFGLDINKINKLKNFILTVDLDEEVVNLLKESKVKYQIILLSDCSKDKAEIIKKSEVMTLFNHLFFSCEQGMSKENSKFFTNLLDRLHLLANECLYVDDNKKNVSTASSLGFKTCLFENANNLALSLSNS